ncbi:MAG: triphosphoribosyl-dephospho-CoA synthase [Acinetobacter populi]|jgi:triphosphoribosyl-dephospho-CoA synthase|uniref:triphosphoribosyl-dephospho-CoA synthase n=1 Tax=Acinetobacter populi TaxID=1582270 RepID=UPI002354BCB8|nr:triphosphoribosyl-dephospho-CoA synthase [Acinetobacter populi]MCH4246583.1 triphosphoribosyl-dephospho-CoA synthase [Acinetobacter populi]
MNAYVQSYFLPHCKLLADLAVKALLAEVNVTPKPALVDQRGSGAHDDLTLELMEQSAYSLGPMFLEMAQAAFLHHTCLKTLREVIGAIGRAGEAEMLETTQGVNTHRGAIWALGLLVTATALTIQAQQPLIANELCHCAAKLAQLEDRFIPKKFLSHGQQVQKTLGAKGAKAQAQQGFPAIVKHGLPQLRYSRKVYGNEVVARIDALLAIMVTLEDTCVLYRAGQIGLTRMQEGARYVLTCGGYATVAGKCALNFLEMDLMQLRASPGGAADLLAATLFLDWIEHHNNQEGTCNGNTQL